MLLAEEVVDGLDGVEGGYGYLNEEGDPVGHGSVPETGELLRLECLGTFALLADETGHGVYILAHIQHTDLFLAQVLLMDKKQPLNLMLPMVHAQYPCLSIIEMKLCPSQ